MPKNLSDAEKTHLLTLNPQTPAEIYITDQAEFQSGVALRLPHALHEAIAAAIRTRKE
jgi:hypothetical protein